MDFSALDHDKIQVDKVYENLDLKSSRNGKNVILTTDIGALEIKNIAIDAIESAIVVDDIV